MYFIYTCIYTIAIIVLLPFEYFKRPKDIRKRWLRQKFGFQGKSPDSLHSSTIWVHAVSVGEVAAAVSLLKSLRERYPSKGLVLSTITDTGQKVARERAPGGTEVVYLPFDVPFILESALRRAKPEMLIIMETELWPNLFRIFSEEGIRVVLLNGRISEKSFRGYLKLSFFMRRVLSHVDLFGMQNEEYADRIRALGVDESKVRNLGNFKFDSRPPAGIPDWGRAVRGPVITSGSTHEGEEELIAAVYEELKRDFPDLNLIVAPRHPERFGMVEQMLSSRGTELVKRSDISPAAPSLPDAGTREIRGRIILLDSVGELAAVYGMTDIAIMGKSFRGRGGQNPLEPAYWGKPVICGPHMENFPVVEEFYKAGAAIRCEESQLYQILKELLMAPEKGKAIGLRAQELYRQNSGAVERSVAAIAPFVS